MKTQNSKILAVMWWSGLAAFLLCTGLVLAAGLSRDHTAEAIGGLVVFFVVGGSLLQKFAPKEEEVVPAPVANPVATSAEEEDFAGFVKEIKAGPVPPSARDGKPDAATAESEANKDLIQQFYPWATTQIAAIHALVDQCGAGVLPNQQAELMKQLRAHVGELKTRAGFPELRPVWEVATALDGLLKQVTGRIENLNISTLRSITGAVHLLGELSVSGIRADLLSQPRIRILAVDDDPVNRAVLAASVKRVFEQPDLAENGEKALELAKFKSYDLIFLDVMMPGMDGFELCKRIRESAANGSTPVVFVTALKDFESRRKSVQAGGDDLIGKPFLPFEIAVKALTLVSRSRLRFHKTADHKEESSAVNWPAQAEAKPDAVLSKPAAASNGSASAVTISSRLTQAPPTFAEPRPGTVNTGATLAVSEEFRKFLTGGVDVLKDQIARIRSTESNEERQQMLTKLEPAMRLLVLKMGVQELRPAFELCGALEGLFKKFQENARHASDSALHTADGGLDLLRELCQIGVPPDLASKPAIRLLVVDDEPVAMRAITGALQMAFSRPDTAESGEAAIELASAKEYDLVFMDVSMPGMDGFETCQRLRDIAANKKTPVVFVTAHSDDSFRARAAECGASDYVVKPFNFIEITVKALTYVLRGRLNKRQIQPPASTAPANSGAKTQ